MTTLLVSRLKKVVEIDHKLTGIRVYADRKNRGLSYRVVAARMNISANYLSDLEKGRRKWSASLVLRYEEAVRIIERDKWTRETLNQKHEVMKRKNLSLCPTCDAWYEDGTESAKEHLHPEPQSGPPRDAHIASRLPYDRWIKETEEGRQWYEQAIKHRRVDL